MNFDRIKNQIDELSGLNAREERLVKIAMEIVVFRIIDLVREVGAHPMAKGKVPIKESMEVLADTLQKNFPNLTNQERVVN